MTSTAARTITYAWIILSAIIIRSWRLAPGHARDAAAIASAPITVAMILWDSSTDARSFDASWKCAPLRGGSRYVIAGWLTVLWTGTLAIYLHQGELI